MKKNNNYKTLAQKTGYNTESVNLTFGRESIYTDPLASYAQNNDQLIRDDAIIKKVLVFLKNKLFSDGIIFLKGGEILVPPDDLQTNIDHYWRPFLDKALDFIFAHGFLVFKVFENSKGIMVPDVPDYELLDVEIGYAQNTAETIVDVTWKDASFNNMTLYVINNQIPFGITPANRTTPVDNAKPFLLQYYQLVENRYVASFQNSRPPLILQHPQVKVTGDAGRNDLENYDDMLERQIYENLQSVGQDNLILSRIRKLAKHENAIFNNDAAVLSTSVPRPWWARAIERRLDRPESRYLYIPHGLSYSAPPPVNPESDFVNMQTSLLENIYNSFGIPYSAIMSTSSKQLTAGLELHKTTLIGTLKTYWAVFKIILTDVYRIMYEFSNAAVGADNYVEPKAKKRKVDKDDDDDQPKSEKELFKEKTSGLIAVYLKSQFQTTPEQALQLYHEGVISFETFQQLRLESVGLSVALADTTVPPPIRANAMNMKDTMTLNENAKAVQQRQK
jgi:hypothetical protein